MSKYTDLEKKVYNALIDLCAGEYSADVADLQRATDLEVPTIKGVLGSLTKKELVQSDEEKRGGILFCDIHPIVADPEAPGYNRCLSFGCDTFTPQELEALKL